MRALKSRRDQEEGGELNSQQSPGDIKSREVELGSESWSSFASVVPQQLCYGHCHKTDLLRTAVETVVSGVCICIYILVASQWPGPHCLNIVVVLAVVHGLLGLLRVGLRGRATHSFSLPLPPPPFPRP